MCALIVSGRQRPAPVEAALFSGTNGKSPSAGPLLASALNALSSSVAVINEMGFIVAVNDAWRRYADENGMRWSRYGIGYNYLSVLDSASQDIAGAREMALGIRAVLRGSIESHRAEYACDTPNGCHFLQEVTGFEHAGARHAVISHQAITLQKLTEAELRAAKEAAEAGQREEALRRAAVEDRLRVAEAQVELLAIASSGRPLDDTLHGMVERICQTLGGQAAAIYSAQERWDRLVPVATCGALATGSRGGRSLVDPSILARALGEPCGLGVEDVWQGAACAHATSGAPARRAACRGVLVSPVHRKDQLYGYLILFYAAPRRFLQADIELGHLFAQQVALALENAELRNHAERVAIENERNRLARELHDAVTQTLFSASIVAEALPRVWERDPVQGKRALNELRLWTRGALAEMRTLLMELRPSALIDKPLAELIRQLGEAAASRLLIPVDCHMMADAEPPAEVKLATYRIAQEALNNMAKHSQASHVEIRYAGLRPGIELTIVDDGCGFEPDRPSQGHMGLGIMRERARNIGAKIAVRSAPGAGTEVRVEWRPRRRKMLV